MIDAGSLPAESGETPTLSAAWFRRERLAISRRDLAQRLQVPQGRIRTLEKDRRSVPVSWIKILAGLGFRIPLGSASSAEPEAATLHIESAVSDRARSLAEETPQAGVQTDRPTRKQAFKRVDGRWLRAERERLGYSRQALQAHMKKVEADTYAFVESRGLIVPAHWRPVLRRLGFQFPTAGAPPKQNLLKRFGTPSSLSGEWLARERSRLGLSVSEVRSALRIPWNVLVRTERHNLSVPAVWIPTLRDLRMNVDQGTAEGVSGAKEEADSPAPASAPPSSEKAAELVELILSYCLKFGRSSGQTPVEILAWIAHDLRQSGVEAAISFDAVEQAVQALRSPKAG